MIIYNHGHGPWSCFYHLHDYTTGRNWNQNWNSQNSELDSELDLNWNHDDPIQLIQYPIIVVIVIVVITSSMPKAVESRGHTLWGQDQLLPLKTLNFQIQDILDLGPTVTGIMMTGFCTKTNSVITKLIF